MLVLSRKMGQQISIGEDVMVTVVSIERNVVRIGIEASSDLRITRIGSSSLGDARIQKLATSETEGGGKHADMA